MLSYSDLLEKVQLKIVEEKGNSAKFIFEPLPVGFGHTLGSSLRRVLLSSIPGAAVTQVKIEGVNHPFTTIPGVREDVVDLLLNIKKIRLRIFNDQPVILKVAATGPGKVSDADFEVTGEGEIIKQNITLATLADKRSKISLELTAESGVGYETAEEHPTNKIGIIPVDSIFSPVLNVSYSIGSARLGQATNLDSLTIEILTDGTVKPTEALKKSSEILSNFFNLFAGTPKSGETEEVTAKSALSKKESGGPSAVDLPAEEAAVALEDLGLSTRTTNALLKARIKNLGDLSERHHSLSKIKGLGQKGLGEISQLFAKEGWK